MVMMKLTKRQLEKIADQTRLLSWGQGAIITSTSGLHMPLNGFMVVLILVNWIALQFISLKFDKWSEK